MWHELLASCSRESHLRPLPLPLQGRRTQVATRYCFIDYDREIGIVAEVEEDGQRKLIGVGRLVADPDHESVEYAVLVVDAWQNRGLGGVLTDYCLEIAGHWGLKRVVAETGSDNARMLALFQRLGFATTPSADGSVIEAARELPRGAWAADPQGDGALRTPAGSRRSESSALDDAAQQGPADGDGAVRAHLLTAIAADAALVIVDGR